MPSIFTPFTKPAHFSLPLLKTADQAVKAVTAPTSFQGNINQKAGEGQIVNREIRSPTGLLCRLDSATACDFYIRLAFIEGHNCYRFLILTVPAAFAIISASRLTRVVL